MTRFTNKVWIVTWEVSTGLGCIDYGIHGIFNKKKLADDACEKVKQEHAEKYSNLTYRNIKVQEVTLDGSHKLFNYLY